MIYLAGPYSHPAHHVRCERYRRLTEAAAKIASAGHVVFSPITHSHPMLEFCGLPGDWEFWKQADEQFIRAADELWVLTLPGWLESTGVRNEINIAETLGKLIVWLAPNQLTEHLAIYTRSEA